VEELQHAAPEIGKQVKIIEDEDEIRKLRVTGAPGVTLSAVAASLWPYKLIAFILEKLIKEQGLNLQTQTPVTQIETLKSGTAEIAKGFRHTLHTPRGPIHARHVILATNGYTSHLLPTFTSLIVPERGIMTALLPPKDSPILATSHGFVGANGGNPIHDDYLCQRPFSGVPNAKGHLMFGGGTVGKTMKMVGVDDDSVIDWGSVQYLKKALLGILLLGGDTDGLEELEATHAWSGIWGTSIDQHPWVGAVPDMANVWLAGGYSGHGMPNGTLCGKAVVDMMLAQERGKSLDTVKDQMVKSGDLPKSYLITKERIERCMKLDSVEVQDVKAMQGLKFLALPDLNDQQPGAKL
jgi:glycine/D-amino acid oxidase-like deaminating enzyme